MKAIVNAVSVILEDIRLFELRPQRERSDVDPEALQSLSERAEATLSNLVTASKTHATSSGMSPVSLLDAAASHVAATVTEIGRTLCIRKATKAEQDQYTPTVSSPSYASSTFSPSLRSVEEVRNSQQRKSSSASASSRRGDGYLPSVSRFADTSMSSNRPSSESRRKPPSEHSSSDRSSPPPIFDQPPVASDDSANADGPEDAWAELKVRTNSRF